jgi:polyisoprenoid-binding protein YceI
MNKNAWIITSSLLLAAAELQAQAAPAKPAGEHGKHEGAATPAAAKHDAPASTSAAAPGTAAKTTPAAQASAANPNDKSVDWTLDPAHSQIGFTARHLGFSKANGHFKKFSAVIKGDPKTAKLSSLEATADTASIDTGIEKRDTHLRSDDFFNAEKYPQLKLVTRSIKWNGSKFTANVDLTIRDVTKSVPFKGELLGVHNVNFGQGEQLRAGYEATATINRKDFGLKWNMVTEGLSVVADPIEIELAAEISYPPTAPTAAATTPASKSPSASAAPTNPQPSAAMAHAENKPAVTPAAAPKQSAAKPAPK